MKISQALQIGHIMDGKKIPSDMQDEHLVYYSTSRERWINIMDMEVCHLVRAFRKTYNNENHIDSDTYLKFDYETIHKIYKLLEKEKNESSR